MSVGLRSADRTASIGHVGSYQPATETTEVAPWLTFRTHARSIGIALATCLVVLIAIELALFRSGFFVSHVTVSNPQTPAAKVTLAARQPNARVVYVGDSTIMTSVLPGVVALACECGPGFNAGFSAATPWLTRALTQHVLDVTNPRLVVISASPFMVDGNARFDDSDLARQLMSPADLTALGAPLDLTQRIDAGLGSVWSAYGQRQLIKEWFGSLAPGLRYDESLLGYWVAPGSLDSHARLIATADRLFESVGEPSAHAPGAMVIGALIDELRARGIGVAILIPPLHPTASERAGPYLERAEVAIQTLARERSVPVVDCRSTVGPADFRDVTHLLKAGAEKHSACVGEQLRGVRD